SRSRPTSARTVEADRFGTHGCWGHDKFYEAAELELSGHLRDDCFTVRCDIIVIGEPRTEANPVPGASFVVVPPPDSSQHFGALLLGGKGADVRFLVGGEVFAAHRCVLAARSPVFEALLFGPMKEGTATESCCIRIDDMLPQVFQSLLHFIYTDSLPETQDQQDKEASNTMAQHMLEAADRYGMGRLKLICEDMLCIYIDMSTVATSLALAKQHRCQGLKEACFEFLKFPKTLDEVMATDEFQHLAKSSPALFELMSKLAAAGR
ncbi:BTB/POZ and MATH domain-containing protein 2-like, partial [Panicum virgatum]|uniref:BTB/POZ and MATH domain-containing protein 2-like n=1 Tax=Panicum virgatum TaxID=38727 RepID=UPI0019D4FCA8